MNTPTDPQQTARFKIGDWAVCPDSGLLLKDGAEVKLEPKAMEVLVYLAENQGKVVSRGTLEAKAWAGVVVGYNAVSGCIIKLRKALGDDSRNPKFIKTVSKRGYQLIAPVSREVGEPQETVTSSQTRPDGKVSLAAGQKIRRLVIFIGATVVGLGLLFVLTRGPGPSGQQAGITAKIPSVLVLPFKNLSDDPQQEYFSEGITDDLITDLSRVDSLRVIARQSSYHYKNNPAGAADIARELDVSYIVEGSVRKSGNRIRINVQLSNTEKGENIWAKRFDTDAKNIFTIQDDIARNVRRVMLATLSGGKAESLGTRGTRNFEAYDAFLLGQQHIRNRSRQGYNLAMDVFQRAIQIDPNYARAYGAMAVTLTRGYRYQWSDLSLEEARERALALANKAVELDQSSPQIYWSLSYVHLHRREYDAAEAAAKQSVAMSPNYADGYALLANIANWRGQATDAVSYIKKATALNPHYTFQYPSTLGVAYYSLGRYKEAVDALRDALNRNEIAVGPRLFLAAAYVRLDRMEDASWEVEKIRTTHPDIELSGLNTLLPFEDNKSLAPLVEALQKTELPK